MRNMLVTDIVTVCDSWRVSYREYSSLSLFLSPCRGKVVTVHLSPQLSQTGTGSARPRFWGAERSPRQRRSRNGAQVRDGRRGFAWVTGGGHVSRIMGILASPVVYNHWAYVTKTLILMHIAMACFCRATYVLPGALGV
jgi:hypothetical protein